MAAPPWERLAAMAFTVESVPSLRGRTFVVTGGNSGIGFEAARVFARRGARLVLACRDAEKMKAAAERICAETEGAEIDLVTMDLSDLSSVRAAAAAIRERAPALDVLVNNAGVMALPERETKDGFEMQVGTNHLGHFALTGLLLPALLAAEAARVVTLSSLVHFQGSLALEDLPKPRKYNEWTAYARSKLANVLFGYELDRRAKAAKAALVGVVCHPGYSATNLQSGSVKAGGSAFQGGIMKLGNAVMAQSAEMGALPTAYAATAPDVRGGEFVGPGGLMAIRGYPAVGKSSKTSHDEGLARELWTASEKLTGVAFAFGPAKAGATATAS
jgi:NAD(P)-dependent dehydrogenase (short-subunit alcohol dehydrogenase family)